ncbi:MAG: HDOD domain-containing protein [Desulforegulaceae bacterium]|nr:HDOD domain-containing protein [Desulforegulaceae bacterium]
MKLKCPHCNTVYNIPDDKIPSNPNLKIKCRKCEGIISFKDDVLNETSDSDVKIESIIQKAKALPPISEILSKARDILTDENRDIRDLAEVLEKDQAMTARILKISNSAYYALKNPVNSVQQACVILGSEILLQMITLASTSKLLGKELKGYSISSGEVFSHSTGVAFASRLITLKTNPELSADAFSAGILHDAGKLLLDDDIIKVKDFFVAKVSSGTKIHIAEKEIFGFDHAQIGYEFLKRWNIPPKQLTAVRWHHEPSKSANDLLSYIVHTANEIIGMESDINIKDNANIDSNTLKILNLTYDQLEAIRQEAKIATEEVFHGFIS